MWIVRETEKRKKNLPVFYKKFGVRKGVKGGVIRISALGIFNLKINGRETEEYFMPGWTNYNKYVHLCEYDISDFLQEENLIEVTLSDGWYSGRLGYLKKGGVYGKVKALFAEIVLSYTDGEEERIFTDESWRVGESEIVTSSFFDGEVVDFRTPKCTDIESLPFAKKYGYETRFEKYSFEPTVKTAELTPAVISEEDGTILLDFKQNFVGFITFDVEGDAGTEITVRHAEILNADGTPYYDNLRSAKATDKAILSGGKDKFEPKFTFHGFRYAEITIKGRAELSDVKGAVVSQKQDYSGKFRCSDEIVNRIFENVRWGQKGNFIGIPTDCPQRDERLGWTGDAQVFCNSAMFNSDCDRFFANYLKLVRTDILPDGRVPSFAPFFIRACDPTAGVPGWADAICTIPYYHYLHYGDKSVIEDNLPFAVKHLEYYLSHCENGLLKVFNPFGDWLSVEKAENTDSIGQCFFGLSALLISRMYAILGDGENARRYSGVHERAKEAFRSAYMTDGGRIKGDSQTDYALALSVGFASADEIGEHFIRSLYRTNFKLTTGFIGVKYLLPALCEIGETDLAYRIIKETEYPSWGYTIRQGATTVWERWNGYTEENGFETPSMNSFNHYCLGSCAEWLYSHVLGIKLSESDAVCISPSFSKELSFAEGECMTRNGTVRVKWRYEDGRYLLTATADQAVELLCDFKDREVLSLEKTRNTLRATLK